MPKRVFRYSTVIKAPPQKIYELLINPVLISENVPGVEECVVVSGPGVGEGTVSRWTWRDGKGKKASWEEEIIQAIPNRKMSFRYHNYRNITGTHELEATPEGTKVTFTEIHDYEDIDPEKAQKDVKQVLVTLKKTIEEAG
ncbi:MAG: SRPBCC family protein [Candidatus Ranarchaeia archaeon]